MTSLTQGALGCLSQAGWTENYRWDPRGWREAVHAEGFRTSSAAVDFLNRFGGLTLSEPKMAATLDPVMAARNGDPSDESRFTVGLGVPISIVGTDNAYLSIWIADDGRVALSIETDFWVIGDDMFDGVNALCEGDAYQVVRARRHLTRGDGAA
jgi:hypothetical protein